MEIVVFILIALVWAFFLLPSFFDNRRQAPLSSTKNFARSTALLASVATSPTFEVMMRRRVMVRRRRILFALGTSAVAALTIAILNGSLIWLGVTIGFDIALAGYIGLLLAMKERAGAAKAPVVPLQRPAAAEAPVSDQQVHTVRVVAG